MSQTRLFPGLVISGLDIGVASATEGFDDIDDIAGILGIGPIDLTIGIQLQRAAGPRPIAKLSPAGVLTSLDNITAGIIDSRTTLFLPSTEVLKPQSLFFTIGDRTFELTANAQIWPRALNEFIGGARGYLVRRLSSTTLGLSRSYPSSSRGHPSHRVPSAMTLRFRTAHSRRTPGQVGF
ncbi:hypothetical protein BJV77DRAFT_965973 [Russula vinacea]|nr:hypothetical protein BJV77DRAFT_965973 [Russula vinacea]